MYIDAHIHSFENQDISGLQRTFLNSTHPGDWPFVAEAGEKNNNVCPFFGIHPWFLDKTETGWQDKLRSLLKKYPKSGVGEIGLDFYRHDFSPGEQEKFFRTQIEIALEYSRPFVVHCTRAWQKVVSTLKTYDLPKGGFMLHSFNKSSQLMRELVDLGGYISYSPVLLSMNAKKLQTAFKETPLDRILLETDFPNIRHYSTYIEERTLDGIIKRLHKGAASLRGYETSGEKNRFYEVICNNAQVFTD